MKVVSNLYERNLLYQQLNMKYAMLMYVQSTLWKLQDLKTNRTKALTLLFLVIYILDFLLGVIIAAVIILNPDIKHQIGHVLSLYTVTMLNWIGEYIHWLMGVPWGIKLNTPVNQFLGSHYLFILNLWRFFYSEFIAVYMSLIVNFLVILLPFGFTISMTALHDFLKFLNLCLICFFVISHRISTLQISALKSLGRLFMGKKWNILKDRIDTCQYNINQLLVGTIIFTILLFLLSNHWHVYISLPLPQASPIFCAICSPDLCGVGQQTNSDVCFESSLMLARSTRYKNKSSHKRYGSC